MKLAILADPHIGVRSDSQVFIDQHRMFFQNVFFNRCDQEEIDTILCVGDLVDKPRSINMKTLSEMHDFFIRPIVEGGMNMHIIPGNHDCYFRDSCEVNAVKELLHPFDKVCVHDRPGTAVIGGRTFGFLPWGSTDFPKADVLCAHLDLVGFEMFKGVVNLDHGLHDLSFAKKYKKVLTGHYHHPSQKGNIHYIGAPIEMTWSDYAGPRGFQIFDTDTLELEYVQNKSRTFRKVAYDDTDKTLETMLKGDFTVFRGICVRVNVKACNDRYILSQFIKKIEDHNPFSVSVMENSDGLVCEETVDTSLDTVEIIETFIDGVNTATDKNKVKGFMRGLYHEAEKAMQVGQEG